MDLNRVQIIGNMTRDPELRTTQGGQSVCSFGVATNRRYTGKDGQQQEQTEFHNIVAWAKLAEIICQYLGKGRKVYIEGRLQTREWQGQDGNTRRTTEIVAENMIMLDRAGGSQGAPAPRPAAAPAPFQNQAAPAPQPAAPAPAPVEQIPTINLDEPTPAPSDPGMTQEDVQVDEIPF